MEVLRNLTDEEAANILYDWEFWARDNQLMPMQNPRPWNTWMILAGRGFGKTRIGAQAVLDVVNSKTAKRIALLAPTAADCRDVIVEGESGILANAPPWNKPVYEPSKRRLTWPNGAIATTYSAEEPEALRGPQHDFAWCDELCRWKYPTEAWDMLQFGLRLGSHPRAVVTTTPKPIKTLRDIMADEMTLTTRGRTLDNANNLAPSFVRQITRKYEGTRLGRQELDAEVLDDVPGALWTREMIEKAHLPRDAKLPEMVRIVVAVDPSGSDPDDRDADESDDIGIVVAGKGTDGRGYILADISVNDLPAVWGKVAVDAYHGWKADRIIAETNFGGAMVEFVIRSVDPAVSFKKITASRGKAQRAEPVSSLYEQGRVSHVGSFPQMEDQMCHMGRDGYMDPGSPDRLDAAVWALTELMIDTAVKGESMLELVRRENTRRAVEERMKGGTVIELTANNPNVKQYAEGSVEYTTIKRRD